MHSRGILRAKIHLFILRRLSPPRIRKQTPGMKSQILHPINTLLPHIANPIHGRTSIGNRVSQFSQLDDVMVPYENRPEGHNNSPGNGQSTAIEIETVSEQFDA